MKRLIRVPIPSAELPETAPSPQVALFRCLRSCILRWIDFNHDWHNLKPVLDNPATLLGGLHVLFEFFSACREELDEYLYEGKYSWDTRLSDTFDLPASIVQTARWFQNHEYDAVNFPTHLSKIPSPDEPVIKVLEFPSHSVVSDDDAFFLGDSMGAFLEILHDTIESLSGVPVYLKPTKLDSSQISNDLGHLYLHCDMCTEALGKYLDLPFYH